MATLETAARNAAIDAITALIDGGAGAGYMLYETSGDVEVARLTFSDPSFGAGAAGVATANAITSDTDADGGVVDHVSVYDSNDNKILEMTAGTSGAEVIMDNLTVSAGATVSNSSQTLTQPAS